MTNCKVVAALVGLGLVLPVVALAQDQPLEEQLVNAMNKVFGVHPGFRANHAKGIVVEGSFKASSEAAGLSRAALFSGGTIPVTARFSDSTGVPNLPDGSDDANPQMAVKFHLPDRSDADIVINSLKFFPVSTGEEFRGLLLVLAESPPNAAKPTRFEEFVASHPRFQPPSALWSHQTASPTKNTTALMRSLSSTKRVRGRQSAIRCCLRRSSIWTNLTRQNGHRTS
jgi:catalase